MIHKWKSHEVSLHEKKVEDKITRNQHSDCNNKPNAPLDELRVDAFTEALSSD